MGRKRQMKKPRIIGWENGLPVTVNKTDEFECMLCGRWHKDGSQILNRHVHEYYQKGGTIPLSKWNRR